MNSVKYCDLKWANIDQDQQCYEDISPKTFAICDHVQKKFPDDNNFKECLDSAGYAQNYLGKEFCDEYYPQIDDR